MQGKESSNVATKEALVHSNRSCQKEGNNKWRQVFVSEYVRSFYILESEPQPDRYKSDFVSRIPEFCHRSDHCECGRKYSDNLPGFCSICDDGFMTYVNDSMDRGEVHKALRDFPFFLPHLCVNSNQWYATPSALEEHMKNCQRLDVVTSDVQIDDLQPIDFSVLSVKELKEQLSLRKIKCPSCPKKTDLIALLEQHEANQ